MGADANDMNKDFADKHGIKTLSDIAENKVPARVY